MTFFSSSLQCWDMSIGKYGNLRPKLLDLSVWWVLIPAYHNDYCEIEMIPCADVAGRTSADQCCRRHLGRIETAGCFLLFTHLQNLADVFRLKGNIPCIVAMASYAVFKGWATALSVTGYKEEIIFFFSGWEELSSWFYFIFIFLMELSLAIKIFFSCSFTCRQLWLEMHFISFTGQGLSIYLLAQSEKYLSK